MKHTYVLKDKLHTYYNLNTDDITSWRMIGESQMIRLLLDNSI